MKELLMVLCGCFWLMAASAQTVTVTAKLLDSKSKDAITSASVKEVKGKNFAITGNDGSFSISLSTTTSQLEISAIGYSTRKVNVSDIKNGEILLTLFKQDLGEVVVTALGIKREKRALGYAVQDIKAEELVKGRTQNLVSAMQGKIAGVNITQGSNGPGSSSQIIIRGSKFLSGTANGAGVLYVIDGVPMDNSIRGTVGEFNGADGGDGIQNISPDDIENISVLKGPNAAALYGSRAINGVIMVTTKKGTSRKGLGVNYSFDNSSDNALLLPAIQTAYGQGSGGLYSPNSDQSWGPKVAGQALVASGWVNNNFTMEGRNVAKEMLQQGSNLNHALSVTSGNSISSVYFSLNYNKQKGIVPGNELTRYIANIRMTTKLSEKLSLESRFTYSNQTVDNRPSGGEEASNPYSSAIRMPIGIPYAQLQNYEKIVANKPSVNFFAPNSTILNNPYWFINRFKKQEIRNRLIGMLATTYNFTTDLSLTARSGFDFYTDLLDNKIYTGSPQPYTNNLDGGNYNVYNTNFFTVNTDFLLTYKKKLRKIGIDATVGANNRYDRISESGVNANGLNLPNIFSFGNAGAVIASNDFSRKKVNSVYGLLQTSFDEWLFADVTIRNDWYSSLKMGNNSLLYPSVNLSAVISDLWKSKPSYLSFAKVRGSYGVAGRDAEAFAVDYYLNSSIGAIGTILTNPSVKISEKIVPEQSRSLEFGTDLRFLNNRINFDFTWYKGNTINQIVNVPLEPSSGFNQLLINAGDVQNKGIEVTLNIVPVKTKKFTYSTTFNFARNRSKVVKVTDGITNFGFASNRVATASAKTGDRLGNLNVSGFRRNSSGQVLIGADGLPLLTDGRSVVAGNIFPDWTGGWNNEFTIGNFSVNLLFDIRQGGVIVSHTEGYLAGLGLAKATEKNRESNFVVDGVREDGSKNTVTVSPEAYYSKIGARGGITGEAFTYSASNMRLRQAGITYNMPAETMKKTPFRSASLSLYGRNLFFVYKNSPMDPDVTLNGGVDGYGVDFYSLPTTRSLGVNLKVGF